MTAPAPPLPGESHPLTAIPSAGVPQVRAGRRRRFVLSPADREVLWLYLLVRLSLWTTAYCARWVFPPRDTRRPASVLSSWQQWDWYHYRDIARQGYFPDGAGPWLEHWDNREAFFPGFPLAARTVHLVVPSWTAAGLLVSFVAGAVAVLALARITRLHLPDRQAPQRAVLFFLLSPCAVFLAAGYTEALFLAFALPAWLAAQRQRWPQAAALACLATSVRVSGLFLAAALLVHFVSSWSERPHRLRPLPWLVLPVLPAALYSWYLHWYTGDWMAWKHAQERGWYRDFHAPWEAWSNTWRAAFSAEQHTGYAFMCRAELLAMVVGLALLALLLRQRRWPEAVYLSLTLWALGTSYWFTSVPRSTLLWWPLWIALAAWSVRRPRFAPVYLLLTVPFTAAFALAFLTGRWTG
ncbi:mannosyltransferase family protein [Streptomyces sp. NPDC050504]|uniref:mannosyltransferase family protein n=1 Tax=Streptomyces sp. NPDC050504 TaxID=3365618 RepID=UPI003795CBBC